LIAMLIGAGFCMATQLGPAGAAIIIVWSLYEILTRVTWWPGRGVTEELRERTNGSLKDSSFIKDSEPVEQEGIEESKGVKGRIVTIRRACKTVALICIGAALALALVYYLGPIGIAISVIAGIWLFRRRGAGQKAKGNGENYDRRTEMRSAAETYPWLKRSKWHFWWILKDKEGGLRQALVYHWTRFYVSQEFLVQDQDSPALLGAQDRFLTTNMASIKDETGNVQVEAVRRGGLTQWFTRAGELKFKTGGEMESLRLADPNWALSQLLKLHEKKEEQKKSNAKTSQQGDLLGVIEKAAGFFGTALGEAMRGKPEPESEE